MMRTANLGTRELFSIVRGHSLRDDTLVLRRAVRVKGGYKDIAEEVTMGADASRKEDREALTGAGQIDA